MDDSILWQGTGPVRDANSIDQAIERAASTLRHAKNTIEQVERIEDGASVL
ncbi:MAG: hypothetical protein LJE94_07170 [Deltaproteobacteria bacterium]|jgi:flavin-binding protein dodecin|nr:hypothetical protein [Deltaproteobacteria bacterium]